MALQLKATVSLNCSAQAFVYTQTTGAYDVTDNPTGFGAPNPEVGDVTSATLVVTNRTTGVEYDPIDFTVSDTDGEETELGFDDLLVSEAEITEIEDGVWEFTLTVVAGGTTYVLETRTLILHTIKCDMTPISKKIADKSCGCCNSQKFMALASEIFVLYTNFKFANVCGDVTIINNQIEELQDLLENINCVNC